MRAVARLRSLHGKYRARPDEAARLQFRDVKIVKDHGSKETILEIEVRGKRGVGWCKSTASAVLPFERLRDGCAPRRCTGRMNTTRAGADSYRDPNPRWSRRTRPTGFFRSSNANCLTRFLMS